MRLLFFSCESEYCYGSYIDEPAVSTVDYLPGATCDVNGLPFTYQPGAQSGTAASGSVPTLMTIQQTQIYTTVVPSTQPNGQVTSVSSTVTNVIAMVTTGPAAGSRLSTGAKAGIGAGVGVGAAVVLAAAVSWLFPHFFLPAVKLLPVAFKGGLAGAAQSGIGGTGASSAAPGGGTPGAQAAMTAVNQGQGATSAATQGLQTAVGHAQGATTAATQGLQTAVGHAQGATTAGTQALQAVTNQSQGAMTAGTQSAMTAINQAQGAATVGSQGAVAAGTQSTLTPATQGVLGLGAQHGGTGIPVVVGARTFRRYRDGQQSQPVPAPDIPYMSDADLQAVGASTVPSPVSSVGGTVGSWGYPTYQAPLDHGRGGGDMNYTPPLQGYEYVMAPNTDGGYSQLLPVPGSEMHHNSNQSLIYENTHRHDV
jgi:hypothetical protein